MNSEQSGVESTHAQDPTFSLGKKEPSLTPIAEPWRIWHSSWSVELEVVRLLMNQLSLGVSTWIWPKWRMLSGRFGLETVRAERETVTILCDVIETVVRSSSVFGCS